MNRVDAAAPAGWSTDRVADPSRRELLRRLAYAGGGLCLGYLSPALAMAETLAAGADVGAVAADPVAPAGGAFAPNAYVRIAPDNTITLFLARSEMGQGIKTSLPMLIAEDLEVDFAKVVVEHMPPEANVGPQNTWGSQSTPDLYLPMRRMGATVRDMLIAAAAATWGVPAAECRAELGKVLHPPRKLSLDYGQLAAKAATLPVPDDKQVKLKERKDFRIIGRWTPGVDNRKIASGRPLYGIDAAPPDLRYAVYTKCPVLGGKPVSANLAEVRKLPGVIDAFLVPGGSDPRGLLPGVAIVAENTWAAISARRKLVVSWDEGPNRSASSEGYALAALAAAKKPGAIIKSEGDLEAALTGAAKRIEAAYSYPFVAHATMEPPNCTVAIAGERMTIWTGTQTTGSAINAACSAARIKKENASLHNCRLGGGFGRRIHNNYVSEAAAIASAAKVPIKLIWERSDDLGSDLFRAAGYHFLRGGLDAAGRICAWHQHFVTFGYNSEKNPGEGADFRGGIPDGVAHGRIEQTVLSTCVPMCSWRAPAINTCSFVFQSFIDELAHAAGKDPLQFRIEQFPGAVRNLRQAAERSGWGKPLPKGRGRGISAGGASLQVAEVTVAPDGTLSVDRITVIANAGMIINPSGARAQIEGSVLDALSATLLQGVTLVDGRIVQDNFHAYPMLRLNQVPELDIVINEGNGASGMGEPYVPATAAAVTNAIFAATGKRIRDLPISQADLAWN